MTPVDHRARQRQDVTTPLSVGSDRDIRVSRPVTGVLDLDFGHDRRPTGRPSPGPSSSITGKGGILAPWIIVSDHRVHTVLSTLTSLTRLHGIGEVRSSALRNHGFRSLFDVAAADHTELTTIDGIGKVRATEIRQSARQLIEQAETTLQEVVLAEHLDQTDGVTTIDDSGDRFDGDDQPG